ncbi:MAG: aminotransferase class V-fold PLP-dependent enzyme [Syntrophomonadaceae bacterium]
MEHIYMDNAATSFPKPECVYNAMDHFNRHVGGSPGRGTHNQTLEAGSVLWDAREALAALFNIDDGANIAFMLNVTEALNTALKGYLHPGDHVITTSMEHNAVARPLFALAQKGVEWTAATCSQEGFLDPAAIAAAIRPNTRMICMQHASNLTGTIMPLEEVGAIARQHDIVFMVDSAQTAGVLEIDVPRQGIDLLAFTGHKGLFGPQGTGGLYVRPGISIEPLKHGGTGSRSEWLEQPDFMPDRLESGTPNTPGIAGLGAAVRYILATGRDKIRRHEQAMTAQLLEGMRSIKRLQIYGGTDNGRRTATVAFNLEGMDCGELSLRLEHDYGITSRSGLHCAPLAHQTLGTLELGACRLSPGFFNTSGQVEQVVQALHEIARLA